jgi:hypothetical protein
MSQENVEIVRELLTTSELVTPRETPDGGIFRVEA